MRPSSVSRRGGRGNLRPARSATRLAASCRITAPSRCRRGCARLLARSVEAVGVKPFELPSGAGHDAVSAGAADTESGCSSCAARTGSATIPTSPSGRTTWPSQSTCTGRSFGFSRTRCAMAEFDLVVRGGRRRPAETRCQRLDIGVTDGLVADVGPELAAGARGGRRHRAPRLPGGVDPHVHFDEPGRTDWEGVATGNAGAGCRRVHDVRRHAAQQRSRRPSTGRRFDTKLRPSRGVVARRLRSLGRAGRRGTSNGSRSSTSAASRASRPSCATRGSTSSPPSTTCRCYEGMKEIAALGSILLLTRRTPHRAGLGARAREPGRMSPRDFVDVTARRSPSSRR